MLVYQRVRFENDDSWVGLSLGAPHCWFCQWRNLDSSCNKHVDSVNTHWNLTHNTHNIGTSIHPKQAFNKLLQVQLYSKNGGIILQTTAFFRHFYKGLNRKNMTKLWYLGRPTCTTHPSLGPFLLPVKGFYVESREIKPQLLETSSSLFLQN